MTWSILLGCQQRNDLSRTHAAIIPEIRLQCERLAIGAQCGRAHQAGIGQRHGADLVAAHQGFHRHRFDMEFLRNRDYAGLNFLQHAVIGRCAG